ncbi:MAG: DUF3540 domain-containing protein [Deltaproteobacteria bacterium]|nr:DUF3540 domain-containing protein [Deltaproteobacteria bacterium]
MASAAARVYPEPSPSSRPQSLATEDGTEVRVEADGTGAAVFRLLDPAGKLVLEHRPAEGRTVLFAPAGDLELRAPAGALKLGARDGVQIQSPRHVHIDAGTEHASSVHLDGSTLTARAEDLDVHAGVASLTATDARLAARTLATAAELVRHVAGVAEVSAIRVVERFRDVYREVEDLQQTRAGRVRTAVQATFHLVAGRAFLKGERDVKVRGAKIHLG